jgi:hypothetical protein
MARQRLSLGAILVVIVAMSAPSWALCFQEAAPSVMACCESVTSHCPQLNQVMTCCVDESQTRQETSATRAEPVAARALIHQPVVLHAALPGVFPPLLLSARTHIDLAVTPPRLTNSVLLI